MTEDQLRYDILTQEALLGMIGKVLSEVGKTGLPGEHHFFITFDTSNPSVQLSDRMREKYPDDMTIVVQHRFWDLEVRDAGFQIGLSFDDIAEHLFVPFASIRGFYDPSVKFGLQFELQENETAQIIPQTIPEDIGKASKKKKSSKKTSKKKRGKPELFENDAAAFASEAEDNNDVNGDDDDEKTGGEVVSLDSFRKKK